MPDVVTECIRAARAWRDAGKPHNALLACQQAAHYLEARRPRPIGPQAHPHLFRYYDLLDDIVSIVQSLKEQGR